MRGRPPKVLQYIEQESSKQLQEAYSKCCEVTEYNIYDTLRETIRGGNHERLSSHEKASRAEEPRGR